MGDDLRLTVEAADETVAQELARWLAEVRVDASEREPLGERVIASRDGARIFLYMDSEEQARAVERVVLAQLGHPAEGRVTLDRWHPVEQAWKEASIPLPETETEVRAEHERQQEREAADSRRSGHAEWEVRVELAGHDDTVAFAERLEAEGIPVVRRYTFLLVGAENEDGAHVLAERLKREAPTGARIEVEPGGQMVWEVTPANPFAVFGGFGA